jgi:hypothetical protein
MLKYLVVVSIFFDVSIFLEAYKAYAKDFVVKAKREATLNTKKHP